MGFVVDLDLRPHHLQIYPAPSDSLSNPKARLWEVCYTCLFLHVDGLPILIRIQRHEHVYRAILQMI